MDIELANQIVTLASVNLAGICLRNSTAWYVTSHSLCFFTLLMKPLMALLKVYMVCQKIARLVRKSANFLKATQKETNRRHNHM